MNKLLIMGTGVHAAEMVEIVDRINAVRPTWSLIGFIAADEARVGETLNGCPVVGTLDAIASGYRDAMLVPDNEWPRSMKLPEERLTSLIDPQSFVSRTARIGKGCVLYPNSFVGLNASVGDYVFGLHGCTINHDCRVGDRVALASGATLAGSVTVESDCYLGQSCSIRQYLRIGTGSMIGMGSVVVKDVPAHSVMAGNPARRIRD